MKTFTAVTELQQLLRI